MRGIPPAVGAILEDRDLARDGTGIDNRIQRLARDSGFQRNLIAEAKGTESRYSYKPRVIQPAFSLQPSGHFHPLSPFQCARLACRHQTTRAFAQVAALYAETTILTDQFTVTLLNIADSEHPWNPRHAEMLAADLVTLRDLAPLIKSGVIQFATPFRRLCPEHDQPTIELANRVALETLELAAEDLAVSYRDNVVRLSSPMFGEGVSIGFRDSPAQVDKIRKLKTERGRFRALMRRYGAALLKMMQGRVVSALVDCRNAAESGTTIAATDPIELLSSKAVFGGTTDPGPALDLRKAGQLKLPWIQRLTPSELVELRERAKRALPNFRLELTRALNSDSARDLSAIADQLQQEVPGLDAELRAATGRRMQLAGPSAMLSGLTMTICGIATKDPFLTAVGAPLFTGGCSLWSTDKSAKSDIERARTKPSYVLLTARELIQKRH